MSNKILKELDDMEEEVFSLKYIPDNLIESTLNRISLLREVYSNGKD